MRLCALPLDELMKKGAEMLEMVQDGATRQSFDLNQEVPPFCYMI